MDGEAVRAVGHRVRGLSGEVSRLATAAAAASADGWQSTAADRWRDRLGEQVSAMHRLAELIGDAADEVLRLAAQCA